MRKIEGEWFFQESQTIWNYHNYRTQKSYYSII